MAPYPPLTRGPDFWAQSRMPKKSDISKAWLKDRDKSRIAVKSLKEMDNIFEPNKYKVKRKHASNSAKRGVRVETLLSDRPVGGLALSRHLSTILNRPPISSFDETDDEEADLLQDEPDQTWTSKLQGLYQDKSLPSDMFTRRFDKIKAFKKAIREAVTLDDASIHYIHILAQQVRTDTTDYYRAVLIDRARSRDHPPLIANPTERKTTQELLHLTPGPDTRANVSANGYRWRAREALGTGPTPTVVRWEIVRDEDEADGVPPLSIVVKDTYTFTPPPPGSPGWGACIARQPYDPEGHLLRALNAAGAPTVVRLLEWAPRKDEWVVRRRADDEDSDDELPKYRPSQENDKEKARKKKGETPKDPIDEDDLYPDSDDEETQLWREQLVAAANEHMASLKNSHVSAGPAGPAVHAVRIAFEYAPYSDLAALVRWYRARALIFPEAFIWHVMAEGLDALGYCAEGCAVINGKERREGWSSIVHGNVRAENMLLFDPVPEETGAYPRVKLCGFGHAYQPSLTTPPSEVPADEPATASAGSGSSKKPAGKCPSTAGPKATISDLKSLGRMLLSMTILAEAHRGFTYSEGIQSTLNSMLSPSKAPTSTSRAEPTLMIADLLARARQERASSAPSAPSVLPSTGRARAQYRWQPWMETELASGNQMVMGIADGIARDRGVYSGMVLFKREEREGFDGENGWSDVVRRIAARGMGR